MLQLDIQQTPAETILKLSGAFDTRELTQLDTRIGALVSTFRPLVVADLSQLRSLTSIGIKAFIRLERKLTICGRQFVIRSAPPHILRVFEYCGLDIYFSFEGTGGRMA
ncbi:MAG TPA: STAS domain-containing protein [Stenomitos sp.]